MLGVDNLLDLTGDSPQHNAAFMIMLAESFGSYDCYDFSSHQRPGRLETQQTERKEPLRKLYFNQAMAAYKLKRAMSGEEFYAKGNRYCRGNAQLCRTGRINAGYVFHQRVHPD